jgi:PAS domain S-box-containing protein
MIDSNGIVKYGGKLVLFASIFCVRFTNPSCDSMFGYSKDELIGKSLSVLIPNVILPVFLTFLFSNGCIML